MGAFFARLLGFKKDPTPIANFCERVINLAKTSFRGVLGTIALVVIISLTIVMKDHGRTILTVWLIMFAFALLHPIHYCAVGFIPMAALPVMGVLSTFTIMGNVMNHGTLFFVIGGYLTYIWNCSGLDKRIAYYYLSVDAGKAYSPAKLIIFASLAAWILAVCSNCVMSTEVIMSTIIPALGNLQSATARSPTEPHYGKLKYQVCNAIVSSSCIGSLAIVHSSSTVMVFRAMYQGISVRQSDPFNFTAYSSFALPFSIVALLVNICVNLLMCKFKCKGTISVASRKAISVAVQKKREKIPPSITCHEVLGIFSLLIVNGGYFGRWYNDFGWCMLRWEHDNPVIIYDVTWSAIMIMALVNFPNSFKWVKTVITLKKSEYKHGGKVVSAILFWRLVDKSTSYAHMFLLCGGLTLNIAIQQNISSHVVHYASFLTDMDWKMGMLVIILGVAFLSNIMQGVAVVVVICPFVLHVVRFWLIHENNPDLTVWEKNMHLGAMAVGMASALGFCSRFRLTPMYFTKTIGKVPLIEQIKSAIVSVIVCALILYAMLVFGARLLMNQKAYIYALQPATAWN